MTIECVTLATNHLFLGNPIAGQHRLRYHAIIERQQWEVPTFKELEYDQYDNPATTYLIYRDAQRLVRGVSRLYPTDRGFILQEHFAHMSNYQPIPRGPSVWEGSRFCIDHTLDRSQREAIAKEIILAYLQHRLRHGITKIVGIMYPIYWRNLFANNGWEPEWLGDVHVTPDGKKSRPAILHVNEAVLRNVQLSLSNFSTVVNYGDEEEKNYAQAA